MITFLIIIVHKDKDIMDVFIVHVSFHLSISTKAAVRKNPLTSGARIGGPDKKMAAAVRGQRGWQEAPAFESRARKPVVCVCMLSFLFFFSFLFLSLLFVFVI